VASWSLGERLHRATIVPDLDAHGSVEHSNPLRGISLDLDGSDRARLRAERLAVICLAGPEAQRRYNPRSWRSWHGRLDHAKAVDIALSLNASEFTTSAHLNWLEHRARDLINAHWPIVEAVAAELIERSTLTGEEARQAIMRAAATRRPLESAEPFPRPPLA
jgi:hypothetical protein